MSTKVLVTGGTGFLGAYILQALVQKGIPVRAIRRSGQVPFFLPEAVARQVEWVPGDVLDLVALGDALEGVSAVIHSAAVVSFHRSDAESMRQVNVTGTANVVNLCIEKSISRLVHVSSVAALGRSGKQELVGEDRKWQERSANTAYARSKHSAEMEVWRGFAEGLQGVILNPSTILGFGNWHRSSCAIFKNAYREFPWFTLGTNGFVGVADVAAAAVALLESELHNRRLIVSAENLCFRDLQYLLADALGRKRPRWHAGPLLTELAWRMEGIKALVSGKRALLTAETARIAHSQTRFDNRALLAALPQFRYQPLSQVIGEASALYLRALKEGTLSL